MKTFEHAVKTKQLLALTAAIGSLALPPTVEAAKSHNKLVLSVGQVEKQVDSRINRGQVNPAALGTLFIKHASINPYNHMTEVRENKITNPLVGPTKGKIPVTHLHGIKFGYIDVVSPQARTIFMKFNPKTMHFVPNNSNSSNLELTHVKFHRTPDGGRFDYSQPLNSHGLPFQNELFGISTQEDQQPVATPPTE